MSDFSRCLTYHHVKQSVTVDFPSLLLSVRFVVERDARKYRCLEAATSRSPIVHSGYGNLGKCKWQLRGSSTQHLTAIMSLTEKAADP